MSRFGGVVFTAVLFVATALAHGLLVLPIGAIYA